MAEKGPSNINLILIIFRGFYLAKSHYTGKI